MKRILLLSLVLWSPWIPAEVLNVEFKFTPFTGDPAKADQVQTVSGKARVFLNNVPASEQDIDQREVPVLFEAREIAPAIWIPVQSLGSAVRKGKNTIRIEFEPADSKAPYRAQLRWAEVTDRITEGAGPGTLKSTNQSGEGVETKESRGIVVFEREFQADFAADQPWHHYPPATSLTEEDRQKLTALANQRAAAFKPKFEGVYPLLAGHPEMRVAEIRKARCLEKAYAAGVRVPPVGAVDFLTTGGPEVVLRGTSGPLYALSPKAFQGIKDEDIRMCAGMVLWVAYPPRLVVVRSPAGVWQAID